MNKHSRGSGNKAAKLLVCEWVRAKQLLFFIYQRFWRF